MCEKFKSFGNKQKVITKMQKIVIIKTIIFVLNKKNLHFIYSWIDLEKLR